MEKDAQRDRERKKIEREREKREGEREIQIAFFPNAARNLKRL